MSAHHAFPDPTLSNARWQADESTGTLLFLTSLRPVAVVDVGAVAVVVAVDPRERPQLNSNRDRISDRISDCISDCISDRYYR